MVKKRGILLRIITGTVMLILVVVSATGADRTGSSGRLRDLKGVI